MKMDKNMTRNLVLAITGITGALLIGILPMVVPTINLLTPIFGASGNGTINVGVVLGASQLGVFYAVWKKLF